MFDPEGKRGKTIDKRREEHKARRGVKGAKVPAYKREDVEVAEEKDTALDIVKKKIIAKISSSKTFLSPSLPRLLLHPVENARRPSKLNARTRRTKGNFKNSCFSY